MLESIEGISNLYEMQNFINKELISDKLDLEKIINYNISTGKNCINLEGKLEAVYNEILKLFDSNSATVVLETASTIKLNPEPAITISDNFVTNMKKPNRVEPEHTLYETEEYNRILRGADKFLDDEKEQERDSMLENINELRVELLGMEGVNIKNIPLVDRNSSLADIKSVYKLLLHKKNMGMYFDTARDVLLIGISKLVNFCDGRPGRPNLVGWERTANLKLNNLKTEMAGMVSSFFKNYNIPPILQILFSLVPSAFLHASVRERQSGLKAENNEALNKLNHLMH